MISNLPKGLSRRVVQAVTDRLRRAMSGVDDVQSAPAVPETAVAPETAGGTAPDAAVEMLGTDVPHRDRSRSPRISEEVRNRLKSELKDERVREFLQKLPAIGQDEQVTTARVFQKVVGVLCFWNGHNGCCGHLVGHPTHNCWM